MTALREFIKVRNREINIQLPVDFDYQEVEVIIIPKSDEEIEFWSEEELNNIGKIGLHSSVFEYDDEDYSKW